MNKQEMTREYKEALANFLEPISLSVNGTRAALGLPPVDITVRSGVEHQVDYFKKGFFEGAAGYYDRWYEDKKAYPAYLAGNKVGREYCKYDLQAIG